MGKKTAGWLITAALLIVIGAGLFLVAMMAHRWNFSKLRTSEHEVRTYEMTDTFHRISIDTDTADISILPSADGVCRVVCKEETNVLHSVSIQDETLTIQLADTREWHEKIGIIHEEPEITVYLPDREYESLSIQEHTGDLEIERLQADTIRISVTTGDTELNNCRCSTLISEGNTGEIELENTIAQELLSIARTTGDVTFECCDAGEIIVTTDTGDVTGSFLTGKVFRTQSSTGRVDVPKTADGGTCSITTTTGDIRLKVLP